MLVHFGLGDEAALHGLGDGAVGVAVATLHIGAGQHGLGSSVGCVRGALVGGVEVADGTAVADDEILEAPFIAQDLLQQTCAAAAGVVVEALVGAHHLAHLSILHEGLEGGEVGLIHIAQADVVQVGGVARVFRTAVDGIVLSAGPQLAVLGALGALQAAHDLFAHDGGQVGVLAIGLLTTSPARVAEDVHVGGPHAEAVELLVLAAQVVHAVVVLCTEFGAGNVKHLI